MRFLRSFWNTLRAKRLDREIREELAAHLSMIEEEERSSGADSTDARHHARLRFGNQTAYLERTRDADTAAWLDAFLQDIRFGLRQLRRNPGFTAIAIALLALGIGLNAAIFTVMNTVVLRALPVPDANRVTVLEESEPSGCCSPTSWLDQRDIRERTHSFQSFAAYAFDTTFLLRLGDRSMRLKGGYVTHDYFATLGVHPVAGRSFTAQEEQTASNVVLVNENVWQTQLHGDPDILHQTVVVNGKACNVIGILPSWFRFPTAESVIWAPLSPTGEQAGNRGWHGFPVLGRLKAGVSFAQARTDLDHVIRQLAREYPEKDGNRTGALFTLQEWYIGDEVGNRLLVLQLAALALFVMACANVSSLLLARDSIRRREFAIRRALGASRGRQIRQHLTESILLMGLASLAAALIAWAGVRFLVWLYGDQMPRAAEISPDWRLIAATLGVAFLAALALGFSSAMQATTRNIGTFVHESGRSTGSRRTLRARKALVILQVTCAVALLGGAGELFQSMWALLHENAGIDTNHLVALHVTIPLSNHSSGSAISRFYQSAVSRIASLPGMRQVAAINLLPVEERGYNGDVNVEGMPAHSNKFYAEYRWIAGDYFRTMHIPLLEGRFFSPPEATGKQAAVIVNKAMAQALWGNRSPIGSRITTETPEWATVVGVVADVRQSGLAEPPHPELFYPAHLYVAPLPSWSLVVRTPLSPSQVVPAILRELKNLDPDAVIFAVRTMDRVIADTISYQRIVTLLLLCFSALAMLLAALGIYGVVSYVVQERTPEFAIRAALGAHPRRLAALVGAQGFSMVIAGVALGAILVIPLNFALAHFLYGVHRLNAPLFALVLLILLFCGFAATFEAVTKLYARQLICGPTSELRTWLLWDLSVEGSAIEFDE